MLVYADNASTTEPLFLDVLTEAPGCWANPSSQHRLGRQSKWFLDRARMRIARVLGVAEASSVIFTASGTEGSNMVLRGCEWDILISTRMEHDATRQTLLRGTPHPYVHLLENDREGKVQVPLRKNVPDAAWPANRQARVLISIIWANNEIGTVQDLSTLRAVRDTVAAWPGVGVCALHLDAVQAPGHLPLHLDTCPADFVSLSAHKFHGPRGVGILYCRREAKELLTQPLLLGGGQEDGLRPGTYNVEGIVRTMHALEYIQGPGLPERCKHMQQLRDIVWHGVQPFCSSGLVVMTGHPTDRLCHHLSFCVRGARRADLLQALDVAGICISGSSACSSVHTMPSHVLKAVHVPDAYIHGSLRITFSIHNTVAQAVYICDQLVVLLQALS